MQDDTDLLWSTQTYQIAYKLLNHNPYNFLNVISTSTALYFTLITVYRCNRTVQSDNCNRSVKAANHDTSEWECNQHFVNI